MTAAHEGGERSSSPDAQAVDAAVRAASGPQVDDRHEPAATATVGAASTGSVTDGAASPRGRAAPPAKAPADRGLRAPARPVRQRAAREAELAAIDLNPVFDDVDDVKRVCGAFRDLHARIRGEIARVIVGQEEIVEGVLTALFANGHVLLEGVPGLGKTLLVRALSETLDLPFSRIQFTPDLMPADIVGTHVMIEDPGRRRREMTFREGPVFAQIVLADEINRATPKTQSALLEAMQERRVTSGGVTRQLQQPFIVLATQNPIEQEGTYNLPEAQLDRFLLKLIVPFTTRSELQKIISRTTNPQSVTLKAIVDAPRILAAQQIVRRIVVAEHVQDYAIRVVLATHPGGERGTAIARHYLSTGASPRGAQALVLAAKVRALLDGRFAVACDDIDAVARPALRHRLIRNFEAEAEGVTTDDVITEILRLTPRHPEVIEAGRYRPWWRAVASSGWLRRSAHWLDPRPEARRRRRRMHSLALPELGAAAGSGATGAGPGGAADTSR